MSMEIQQLRHKTPIEFINFEADFSRPKSVFYLLSSTLKSLNRAEQDTFKV